MNRENDHEVIEHQRYNHVELLKRPNQGEAKKRKRNSDLNEPKKKGEKCEPARTLPSK